MTLSFPYLIIIKDNIMHKCCAINQYCCYIRKLSHYITLVLNSYALQWVIGMYLQCHIVESAVLRNVDLSTFWRLRKQTSLKVAHLVHEYVWMFSFPDEEALKLLSSISREGIYECTYEFRECSLILWQEVKRMQEK